MQQVFRVRRRVTEKKTGAVSTQIVYGITSLSPAAADAARLLTLVRQHWHIENKPHWIRDVVFDEDRAQTRQGRLPQVMATLRNAVIGLMRASGFEGITQARRRFAARQDDALSLIGIPA